MIEKSNKKPIKKTVTNILMLLMVTMVTMYVARAVAITSVIKDETKYLPRTTDKQDPGRRMQRSIDERYARYIPETPSGTQVPGARPVPTYSMFPNKYLTPASAGVPKKPDLMALETNQNLFPWLKKASSIDEIRLKLKQNPGAINARDYLGRNGLMIAIDLGDTARAKLLIANKIDINALSLDEQRSTALHILARKSRLINEDINMLKILIKAGANVNAVDAMGRTPLHWLGGIMDPVLRTYFTDILMSNGADINIQDNNGQTSAHNQK